MPRVLTTKAKIMCPHGGVGISTPSVPWWSVNGGFVLRDGDTGLLACPLVLTPCFGYTLRSMGLNSTKIMGLNVILETDFNQTVTGLPLTMLDFHTTLDDSTASGVPATGPAPPLPPALLDLIPPIVTGQISSPAFTSSSMTPPTVTATFNLSSAFPLKWVLTRIRTKNAAGKEDLTNGNPPGAVVTTPGGSWTSPSLTVTLTMTAAYMKSIQAGDHHFFMTGVSQRGLSSHAEVLLTVS